MNTTGQRSGVDVPKPAPDELWTDIEPDVARRLLEAAVDEFATSGFHATTTRTIAERVALSPAALYVHYRSKQDLLFAIVHTCHVAALDEVVQAIANTRGATDQLHTAVKTFVSWHARHSTAARVAQSELRSLEPDNFRTIAQLRSSLEEAFETILAKGQHTGEFDRSTPARDIGRALLSLGIDVSRWYRSTGEYAPDEIGDLYGEFAVRIATRPSTETT